MDALLEIEDLKKYYGKEPNQTKALNGITFQVMPGEFLGIMGSSGSGKSTLLNCIATVIQPDSGKIRMKGTEIQRLKGKKLAGYRGKEIGYLFQNFELLDNLTGRENIMVPLSIILADEPTGALDSRNAKALMEKLAGLNRDEKATVLMVTHDSNAASYCKRILFIQDGVIFHELRRDLLAETQQQFYERILQVMAQLGGGSANVL